MLGEELLREPTDLDIVTSKTAEILDEHRRRPAEFELGYHVLIAGSVHRDTGDAVVEEVDEVGVSLFLGDLGQQLLLERDLSREDYTENTLYEFNRCCPNKGIKKMKAAALISQSRRWLNRRVKRLL